MTTKEAAKHLGRIGGKARSRKKTEAVRKNAKKGGWPKGKKRSKIVVDYT
jgi:hypothetical protein